jgi:hypothetical protein
MSNKESQPVPDDKEDTVEKEKSGGWTKVETNWIRPYRDPERETGKWRYFTWAHVHKRYRDEK